MKKEDKGFVLICIAAVLATLGVIAFFICGATKVINPTSIEWIIACIVLFGLMFLCFCCWCVWDSYYRDWRSERNERWR